MNLASAPLTMLGQFTSASNATLLVWLGDPSAVPSDWRSADPDLLAVYKPQRGERPLWDFPQGTLHRREVAAFLVGRCFGDLVPETVLRTDGPYGIGSVQRFVAHDPRQHYFTLFEDGAPLVLAQLQRMVVFDLIVNNADRKAGHVLFDGTRVRCIDHGITFHHEPKVRTVAWDFAGEAISESARSGAVAAVDALEGRLGAELDALLDPDELDALHRRAVVVAELERFPRPSGPHPVPWPPL